MKYVDKECSKHGIVTHRIDNNGHKKGHPRCVRCQTEAIAKYRLKRKLRCVAYLGNQCNFCGYSKCVEALEFHHRDPTHKDFQISGSNRKKWEDIEKELSKCLLLCANCHREEHFKIRQLPTNRHRFFYEQG